MNVLQQAFDLIPTKVVRDWDVLNSPETFQQILDLIHEYRLSGGHQRDVCALFGDARGQYLWERSYKASTPELTEAIQDIYVAVHVSHEDEMPELVKRYKELGGTLEELQSVNRIYGSFIGRFWKLV